MFTINIFGRKYQVSKKTFAWIFPIVFAVMITLMVMTVYAIYASSVAIGDFLGVHWIFILIGTLVTFFPIKISINNSNYSTSVIGDNEYVHTALSVLFFASALYIGVSTIVTVFIYIYFVNTLITQFNKLSAK